MIKDLYRFDFGLFAIPNSSGHPLSLKFVNFTLLFNFLSNSVPNLKSILVVVLS